MLYLPKTDPFKEVIIIRATTLSLTLVFTLFLSGNALADDEWTWADDLALGSRFPEVSVVDIRNTDTSIQSLYGKKGLLLFFSRSTQW